MSFFLQVHEALDRVLLPLEPENEAAGFRSAAADSDLGHQGSAPDQSWGAEERAGIEEKDYVDARARVQLGQVRAGQHLSWSNQSFNYILAFL